MNYSIHKMFLFLLVAIGLIPLLNKLNNQQITASTTQSTTLSLKPKENLTGYKADYVKDVYQFAIREEARVGIPAWLTAIQGLLESDGGQSDMAQESNNQFGIKCGIKNCINELHCYHRPDKDDPNAKYRMYKSISDSFEDHSYFLVHERKSRYAKLFDCDMNDYECWALELKKAGYAEDPKYAEKLIKLTEQFFELK